MDSENADEVTPYSRQRTLRYREPAIAAEDSCGKADAAEEPALGPFF